MGPPMSVGAVRRVRGWRVDVSGEATRADRVYGLAARLQGRFGWGRLMSADLMRRGSKLERVAARRIVCWNARGPFVSGVAGIGEVPARPTCGATSGPALGVSRWFGRWKGQVRFVVRMVGTGRRDRSARSSPAGPWDAHPESFGEAVERSPNQYSSLGGSSDRPRGVW